MSMYIPEAPTLGAGFHSPRPPSSARCASILERQPAMPNMDRPPDRPPPPAAASLDRSVSFLLQTPNCT